MMNEKVVMALLPLGLPVAFQRYNGSKRTYITFFEYNQNSALDADDREQNAMHYIQVDLWSYEDYSEIVPQVREALLDAGFIRTSEAEFYETDTQIYHKLFRIMMFS